MRKFLSVIFGVCAVLMGAVSCDDANDTTEGYTQAIFTIEGNRVYPELSDTFYVVKNADAMGLQSGDRGWMRINFFVDNMLGMGSARYEIGEVIEQIPVLALSDTADVDDQEYSLPVNLEVEAYYGAFWAWRKYQNIKVAYKGNGAEPDFKMVVTGYDSDTLHLSVLAKYVAGDIEASKLLCYDLRTSIPMLEPAQQSDIMRADTLVTKIKLNYIDNEDNTLKEGSIIGGKIANPFRN